MKSLIHVSKIDYLVEADTPLPTMESGPVGEVEAAIGRNCASLIEDGSTLQLGIGSIPDAVLKSLTDKKDLGIHSEMIADGVIDLYERGIINGAKKTIHKGKIVVAFLMGSQRLYDFVHNNPDVEVLPVDHVNDPWVIGQNSKMVSINSCLQVDFNGQVNSESMGTQQFSGVGGQLDYIRGSFLSPGGKAILAMPSTAKKGTLSRIVPVFEAGTTVTTPRTDTHYIVTEYGIANLRGKSLRERASPSQAFMLFAAYQFDNYEKLEFTFTGESTCSDSWTRTFMTGKPSLALPCFADCKFSGVGEWELRVTLTPDDVLRCVDGLGKMFKNGLRHPIAPSSLTTDITEGLPASYLKF